METEKKFHGLYRGVVVDNRDPDKVRRLKVRVPQVTGDTVSTWCWPVESASVVADPPSPGTGVWVQYEGGDPAYPVWVGTFGKRADKATPLVKPLKSAPSTPGLVYQTVNGRKEIDLAASVVSLAALVQTLQQQLSAHASSPHN